MKEILFGTTNEAKVKQLQGALAPIGVTVKGVDAFWQRTIGKPLQEFVSNIRL